MFVGLVIRPPRAEYADPGTKTEQHNGKSYKLESFTVNNAKGEKLSCSFVEPANDADRSGDTMPCVIYMHGNASCKLEGLSMWRECVEQGINLCTFDFSGCGNSEGEWVTLGWKEKDDLAAVIEYLYEHKRVSNIGLWGRSMGAATSVLHVAEGNPVNAVVLDSGFSDLQGVMTSIASQMMPPEFI